jgi:hypothetical protein
LTRNRNQKKTFIGMAIDFQLEPYRKTVTLKKCVQCVADYFMPILNSWWCAVTPTICACNLAAVISTL